jgi:uncharacterized protein YoxC
LGSSEAASEGKQPESQTNGRMKGIEQETDNLVKDNQAKDDMEEKSGAESMVTEIKDIEELLVDLKDKVRFCYHSEFLASLYRMNFF